MILLPCNGVAGLCLWNVATAYLGLGALILLLVAVQVAIGLIAVAQPVVYLPQIFVEVAHHAFAFQLLGKGFESMKHIEGFGVASLLIVYLHMVNGYQRVEELILGSMAVQQVVGSAAVDLGRVGHLPAQIIFADVDQCLQRHGPVLASQGNGLTIESGTAVVAEYQCPEKENAVQRIACPFIALTAQRYLLQSGLTIVYVNEQLSHEQVGIA